ncbi:hypothetical protein AVEN_241338-1 [Araneus ventricosus]|uniref:Uncharacterized protein n=1 Tax=Araneus ventricosus TaxID=182803 RepID=A0A4Y2TSH9_ARAVE|nr:hypothetical protein AVEN_241338-1 [Araneus ventricosus]
MVRIPCELPFISGSCNRNAAAFHKRPDSTAIRARADCADESALSLDLERLIIPDTPLPRGEMIGSRNVCRNKMAKIYLSDGVNVSETPIVYGNRFFKVHYVENVNVQFKAE